MRLVEIDKVGASESKRWINPEKVMWVAPCGSHKDECTIAVASGGSSEPYHHGYIEIHVLNDPQTVVNLLMAG